MKLIWVDVAKGIAIILVVYGYVLDGLFKAGKTVPIFILVATYLIFNLKLFKDFKV